ncbi:hypothetical protein DAT35_34340 [Vitiosangium sp. GDMCC 1.1324]|nr:hypothetical protein DAT35_34340 [Vitiosangium sp. GDMCC 1.1324]
MAAGGWCLAPSRSPRRRRPGPPPPPRCSRLPADPRGCSRAVPRARRCAPSPCSWRARRAGARGCSPG